MVKIDYSIASTEQIQNDLANRLNQYRIQCELTQEELAEEAAISVATLSRLLRGKGGTLNSFLRVLRALRLLEHLEYFVPSPKDSPFNYGRKPLADRQRVRAKTAEQAWSGFNDTAPIFDDD